MENITKGRELRSRRAARRRGLSLSKARAFNPESPSWGRWTLTVDATGDTVPGACSVPFDVVEAMLDAQEPYGRTLRRRLVDAYI